MKVSQKNAYGTGLCSNAMGDYNDFCKALPEEERGHYLGRGTVSDEERLQNFSIDTQLETKFATDNIQHTLLTGVDYMRMRNDIKALFGHAPALDLNNYLGRAR